ncbi:MAG TPA: hypothetical protein VMI56_08095 [Reyranella sp.]|nr:hypothetical protein [Reyranella sp.]
MTNRPRFFRCSLSLLALLAASACDGLPCVNPTDLHTAAAFEAPDTGSSLRNLIKGPGRPDVWQRNRYVERLFHQVLVAGGEPALDVKYKMECAPNPKRPDCRNCSVCSTMLYVGNQGGGGALGLGCSDIGRTFVRAEITPFPEREVTAITYRRFTTDNTWPPLPEITPPYPE